MLTSLTVLMAVLVVATCLGWLWRRTNGRFKGLLSVEEGTAPVAGGSLADQPRTSVDVPGETGERATLLQFSSAFCAPCRSTRRTLAEVAAMVPGVKHVEVDAEAHLELVRRLGVMRTPTTFVLDANGAVVSRASGQPRKADVIAALGRATR